MAETPPSGSLLSNFLSGGGIGRTPFGPERKKKGEYIDPKKLPPDQAAMIGAATAAMGINALSSYVEGIKEGLIGKGVLRRFGGEEKIAPAAYDYAKTALDNVGEKDLLRELDLETEAKFKAKYAPAMQRMQDEDNRKRLAEGKQTLDGFGNYEVKTTAKVFLNPVSTATGLSGQQLALSTKQALDAVNLGGDHTELSFFTKEELTSHIPRFLRGEVGAKIAELDRKKAAYTTYTVRDAALHKRLQALIAVEESNRNRQDEDKKGPLWQVKQSIRERVFNKGAVREGLNKLSSIYREIDFATKDPLGFAFSRLIVRPVKHFFRRYLWGEQKLFGKWLGGGWGKKFGDWLDARGKLGQLLRWGGRQIGISLQKGLGALVKNGLSYLGKTFGRFVIGSAIRAGVYLAGAAIGAIIAPIGLIIGGTILVTAALMLVVMFVLIPFFTGLNPAAQAAPLDLAVTAQAVPSSDVGPDELVQVSIQVTANKDARDLTVKVEFDSNFSGGSISGGADGTVSGSTVTLPKTPYTLVSAGQPTSFQISAKTNASMSRNKIALIAVTVSTSNSLFGGASVALNGAGVAQYDPNYPYGWPMNGPISQGLHADLFSCAKSAIFTCGTAVDIAVSGSRVCATMDGVVVRTDDNNFSNPGYGPWIRNEKTGFWTIYNHMDPILEVKAGDRVRRGQFLGFSDNSGITNGPHLHYSIYSQFDRTRSPGTDFYQYVPSGNIDPTGTVINSTISNGISC